MKILKEKVIYWVCILSPAHTTIKSKSSLTKMSIVYLDVHTENTKQKMTAKNILEVKPEFNLCFILAVWVFINTSLLDRSPDFTPGS